MFVIVLGGGGVRARFRLSGRRASWEGEGKKGTSSRRATAAWKREEAGRIESEEGCC